MPGFEDEREKLQEYLGIEWIPHGLDHDCNLFIYKYYK
jgi:hypothetical protein